MTLKLGNRIGIPKCTCQWTDRSDYKGEGGKGPASSTMENQEWMGKMYYRLISGDHCPVHPGR
jgi:hypothetical protein